jgi:hypothetical protein
LKTNEEIVTYLVGDLQELIVNRQQFSENDIDGFYDYLGGIIDRSQSVLRMMGIPEELIPQEEDC